MRRVVITGLGLVTPLGDGVDHNWSRLLNSESGIRFIDSFDVSDLSAKIAGMVPVGESGEECLLRPRIWSRRNSARLTVSSFSELPLPIRLCAIPLDARG